MAPAPQRKSLFTKAPVIRPETFPIRVESYDLKSKPQVVIGTRLDTQERVSVHLRDVELNLRGNYKRPAIADFARERKLAQDPGTTPGGVLLVEEGVKEAADRYGARWIRSLSHSPDEAEVMLVTAHVTPVRRTGRGKRYSLLTFLHDGNFDHLSDDMVESLGLAEPARVASVAELRETLLGALESGIGAGVRIKMGDDFDANYVRQRKDVTPEQAVSELLERLPQEACDAIDAGDALCEVIPYGNIWAGPMTLGLLEDNPTMKARVARYSGDVTGDDGETRPARLYRPTVVAMRFTNPDEDGRRGVIFTHVEPLQSRNPVIDLPEALMYARTAEFSPEPPRIRLGGRPEAGQPAGDFDGTPSGEVPSHGSTDDDVMGASFGGDAPASPSSDAMADDVPRLARGRRAAR